MRRVFTAAAMGMLLAGPALAQTPAPIATPAKDAAASRPEAATARASKPAGKDADAAENDISGVYRTPVVGYDYVKRVEMIPMRDGAKLYTVIWVPKGAHDAPIILTRHAL